MDDTATTLLIWLRGPGFEIAFILLVLGLCLRLLEIFGLGRRADLAPARQAKRSGSGWQTILRRFLIPAGMVRAAPGIYLGGYLFHIGLAVVILTFVPHILFFQEVMGIAWPGLPNALVDGATVLTILAMLVVLACRIAHPVRRYLSTFEDYLVWTLTFLPLASGYLACHHLLLPYAWALALHLLSVQLLMVALPFTRLIHTITAFSTRWYNGETFSRRGVVS